MLIEIRNHTRSRKTIPGPGGVVVNGNSSVKVDTSVVNLKRLQGLRGVSYREIEVGVPRPTPVPSARKSLPSSKSKGAKKPRSKKQKTGTEGINDGQ